MKARLRTLRDVLQYRNPDVVARFAADYGIDARTATVVFRDMLRFLWLSAATHARAPTAPVGMYSSMAIVDEMWHTFILFSREYADFCGRYFGFHLHHSPARASDRRRKGAAAAEKRGSDATVETVWRELGPRIARRWFHEYGLKYPMVELRRLQLQAAKKKRTQTLSAQRRVRRDAVGRPRKSHR